MINQALAKKYWSNEDPVGKRLELSFESSPREIVGVVSSVKHFGLESTSYQEMYSPESQSGVALKSVVVRTTANPSKLVGSMRQAVHDLASDLPVYDVKVMADRIDDSMRLTEYFGQSLGNLAMEPSDSAAMVHGDGLLASYRMRLSSGTVNDRAV